MFSLDESSATNCLTLHTYTQLKFEKKKININNDKNNITKYGNDKINLGAMKTAKRKNSLEQLYFIFIFCLQNLF